MTHSHKVLEHIPLQIKSIPCSPSPYDIYKKKGQLGTSAWTLRPALAIRSQAGPDQHRNMGRAVSGVFQYENVSGKLMYPRRDSNKHPGHLTILLPSLSGLPRSASAHTALVITTYLWTVFSSKTETAVGSRSNFQFSFYSFWNHFLQQQQLSRVIPRQRTRPQEPFLKNRQPPIFGWRHGAISRMS